MSEPAGFDLREIEHNAHMVAAMAKAAIALLSEHSESDSDDDLVSVRLTLRAIAEKSTAIGAKISASI
jgi:hypothetical protein